MALDWVFFLNLIFSLAGIIFFLYSLFIVRRIKQLFPGTKVVKKWLLIQTLIVIFLFGYVFNIIFIALDQDTLINIMTATVYLFGGLFVLIIINLSYRTYRTVLMQPNTNE